MEKWVVSAKKADFNQIGQRFGIDMVTARIIRNRGIIGDPAIQTYLHGGMECLGDPKQMKDIQKSVAIIKEKVEAKKKIRVIGDYDIDGVMSTYILQKGLKRIGAVVDVTIPNRITDGYGINIDLVAQAIEDGIDTIITCDNGIAALDQIAYAKEQKMTVIVTDHHEIPYEEDEQGNICWKKVMADAVVNPKQEDCTYPFSGLCGAAVAYKLVVALYREYGISKEEQDAYLEYVAFATIGDVMDLVEENRILVKEGLKRLHHTKNTGLLELIKINGLNPEEVTPYHIGFVLGPCLNASGRLDTARRSLALLMSEDIKEAAELAGDLKSLNDSRKTLTQEGMEEAFDMIEKTGLHKDKVLVVYLPQCHESLAGIIAGRIREKYNKPAFVLTDSENGQAKGSGRSIEAYSMYDELVKCQNVLSKFGGHPMAAGLSLEKEKVDEFRKLLNQKTLLTDEDLVEKIVIDVPMPISYVRENLIEEFKVLEPFGKGNTKPVFAQRGLKVSGIRILGKNRNVAKMILTEENGISMDGIYFGNIEQFEQEICDGSRISVTYYPDINEFRGKRTIQIVITHYQVM